MQSVRSRIWTRIAVSIYCDDNHYITGTSQGLIYLKPYQPTWLYFNSAFSYDDTFAVFETDIEMWTREFFIWSNFMTI